MRRERAARRLCNGRYHKIRELLHGRFPAAFPARGAQCAPLKIGVKKDLGRADLGLSLRDIAAFLCIWSQRREYLERVADGTERVDLEGVPCGLPSPAQRDDAGRWLEAMSARRAAA